MPPIREPRLYYPRQATIYPWLWKVLVGGDIAISVSVGNILNMIAYQPLGINGNSLEMYTFLAAGTYTLGVFGSVGTNKGKLDWYMDDVKVVTGQDWYHATNIPNTLKTTSIPVIGNGHHKLKYVVNGKHAGSSDYCISMILIYLKRSDL